MPDIKGDELLQIIHERSPNTLKIMLTGQADLQAVSNAIRYAKLYRYIPKPWQNEDLKLTVVEAVHSYLQDQKLADEVIKGREVNRQLQIVNEELSASESRLNQFLAALPVGVSVYNPDGSIAYVNHSTSELLEANTGLADSMLGNSLEQLVASSKFYDAENDRLYFDENFPILRALKGESVQVSEVEIIQCGLKMTLSISARPIFDSNGNIVFAIAVIQDISQRKELENLLSNYQRTLEAEIVERTEQLQKAAFAAEAANRAKSIFLANMSHELRTPLNAILGFTQILEPSPNLTADDRENIRIIYRSGEHLLTLINQALDLAKIEAGRMILFPTNFDLYCLLDELQEMFDLRAKNQDLQLIFHRGADIPQYVRTDEVKLRQVLINLLSNAMKFTQTGGVSVRVRRKLKGTSAPNAIASIAEISAEGEIVTLLESSIDSELEASTYPEIQRISGQSESDILAKMDNLNVSNSLFLEFEIEDTGVGISPEELGNLFQAFVQTTSGQKAQQGTGLGLTISNEFVRLMGGTITVESQLEQGTIFRFEIQVSAVDSAAISTPKIVREVIGLAPNQPYYRILVVDDRIDNRKLLVKMLSALGFAVEEASNGREAVEMWENWQPHLIFMDLRMPVMDGYEATIEIRSRIQRRVEEEQGEENMDIPDSEVLNPKIIALTASTHEDKRSFSLLVGCDDFIRKPFRKTDIFDTLSKHLGVSYIYSDLTGSDSMGDRNNLSNSSNAVSDSLPNLPAEWIDNMRQVIRSADFDLIGSTIEEIRDAHPEFADILQGHLDNFDYRKILNLIIESEQFNSTGEV